MVEGAWHREAYVLEHPWDFDEVFRERLQSRYWMLLGGVRREMRQGRVAPYYQVLAGGFAARFRRDNEWPASIDTEAENAACGGYVDGVLVLPCLNVPYPEFDEERSAGFVMQPGMGVDVNVLAAIHAASGGRSANPGGRRLRRPAAEALRPYRRRAGALTPREDRIAKERARGDW